MEKFIYVFDDQLKDQMLTQGFKLVTKINTVKGNVWVFENNFAYKNYLSKDDYGVKYAFTNKMNFEMQ